MKKEKAEAFEMHMQGCALEDVERSIKKLKGKISNITTVNENLRDDPRKALCDMKEEELKEALEAYGKVDMSTLDMDRIPLVFARLQANEAAARNSIANLRPKEQDENDLKKQLEIAKKILAQKIQPGGRA